MTATPGVVACSTLYAELGAFDADAVCRFVPQELHESPMDPGDPAAARDRVQAAVDGLSGDDRPHVAVAYARSEDDLVGVTAREVPLVVWRVGDCVDALLGADGPGDPKEPGTFYLTRGSIDRGVDPFKLYLAYRGEAEGLVDWFDSRVGDTAGIEVTWHRGGRMRRAIEAGAVGDIEAVRDAFRRQLSYYDRVALVDTDTLEPVHRAYARRFVGFLADVLGDGGDRPTIDLGEVPGDPSILESMLGWPGTDDVGLEVVGPGDRVGPLER